MDTVLNQGASKARRSTTRYYLKNDQVKKNLKGSREIGRLRPAAQSKGTTTVTLYTDTLPGTYALLACADDTELVGKSGENKQLPGVGHNGCGEPLTRPSPRRAGFQRSARLPGKGAPGAGTFALLTAAANCDPGSPCGSRSGCPWEDALPYPPLTGTASVFLSVETPASLRAPSANWHSAPSSHSGS